MPEATDKDKLEARARASVIAIATVIVLVQWIVTMVHPRGDFVRHWEFGRRFVAGEFLYAGGLNVPYPPFFAMAHAPLSLLPTQVAMPVLFVFGFGSLAALLWILDALSRQSLPLPRGRLFWVIAGTLFVASRFVLRDFADAGQNLVLLGLVWGAIHGWSCGKTFLAGASLGVAVALKCTPALFILYFALKRQWKFVGIAVAVAAALTLAPALVQSTYSTHLRTWIDAVAQGVLQPNPSVGVLGPELLQNKSLRPALARYLMNLPAGHPGRFESAGYIDFLNLSPKRASIIIKVVMLASLGGIVWLFRRPLTGLDDPMLAWECAALSLLSLLYSPITWGQHCVAAIPAIYLVLRSIAAGRTLPRWVRWALGVGASITLLSNRSIIGRDLSLLVESYHLVTLCMVVLLIAVLHCRMRFER